MNLTVVLISILFMALAFGGIAIKIIFKKNGDFAGTCASNNPVLNEEGKACSVCGALPDEKCQKD